MGLHDLVISRVRVTDLLAITRMTRANMVNADMRFTELINNPLYRWTSYVTLPLYFLLAGQGYKVTYRGVIIGCAFLHIKAISGFVFNVNVNRPYRRRGVGRQLMRHLEAVCQQEGRRWLALQVDARNLSARSMYENLGFQAFHPFHLRWEGGGSLESSNRGQVRLRSLPGHQGATLYRQLRDMERSADRWPSTLAEEYDPGETWNGTFYRCLFDGDERGCAWLKRRRGHPIVKLALDPELWGKVQHVELVREILWTTRVSSYSSLDLQVASNTHYKKVAPALMEMGFRERTMSRLLMVKELPPDEQPAHLNSLPT